MSSETIAISAPHAPLYLRWLTRIAFSFLGLQIPAWCWSITYQLPGFDSLRMWHYALNKWLVEGANSLFFHVRPTLVPKSGSGDTSFGWAELWTYLSLSLLGGTIWLLADRRRSDIRLIPTFYIVLRYYIASVLLSYGVSKLFLLQMPFPSATLLATPLGDLDPMRLSWAFIGYSAPYQFFSGLMEVLAGLLLIWRRTATAGAIVASGVFLNIVLLNLCYDIVVKIFSCEMLAFCIMLVAGERNRIFCFFFSTQSAPCSIHHRPSQPKRTLRRTRIAIKSAYILIAGVTPFISQYDRLLSMHQHRAVHPLQYGLYNVTRYTLNGDTMPFVDTPNRRWDNICFDAPGRGSAATTDGLFSQACGRAHFYYQFDTAAHLLTISQGQADYIPGIKMSYQITDSNTFILNGHQGKDSVMMVLRKSPHKFKLVDRPFHWVSDY